MQIYGTAPRCASFPTLPDSFPCSEAPLCPRLPLAWVRKAPLRSATWRWLLCRAACSWSITASFLCRRSEVGMLALPSLLAVPLSWRLRPGLFNWGAANHMRACCQHLLTGQVSRRPSRMATHLTASCPRLMDEWVPQRKLPAAVAWL